jgi:hypothetical protein
MKNIKLSPFIIAFFVFIHLGCRGPAGPLLTGNLEGSVILYHDYGAQFKNFSGVTVSLEGSSLSTQTDSLGWWTLTDVQTGTYSVCLKKDGFFTEKHYGIQFVGGGTYYLPDYDRLTELPTYSFTGLKCTSYPYTFSIYCTLSSSSSLQRYISIFLDSLRTVSKDKYGIYISRQISIDSSFFYYSTYTSYLPFSHKQWIYVKCYASTWSANVFYDPITRQRVTKYVSDTSSPLDSIYVQ